MDVNELIRQIDDWRTAFVVYKLAIANSPKVMSQERRDALDALDQAAMRVHGVVHQDKTYVAFERLADEIQRLQDKLTEANNNSVNTLRERMLKQEQDEIAQEAWLRERLKLLRFPIVEDVYVSSKHTYYVTFSRLLSRDEILLAGTVSLAIERTQPLRNRYHIVFQAPDKEEA